MSKTYANLPDKKPFGLFGRSKGKTLSPAQKLRIENLLPTLAIATGAVDPAAIWPEAEQVWVEIGIGGGEHFVQQADANKRVHLIGFEPFQNGMAKTLGSVEQLGLSNISLEMGDARLTLQHFTDHSLDRVFILYPDPWPKVKHWKRRLITLAFIKELSRLVKPGGEIRFVSDIAHYQQWALSRFLQQGDFIWTANTCHDWQQAPKDHFTTKYEQKAFREKRQPAYLHFIRKGL
ncbi:MAG: tRNA (guanosine(46)-N7)-methyltransferase TrmB [Robiginitomaculum sp.]|nr:tRNA (guanosine(46)-N7)-methyltransferase TrmB [Robiginitomaculum sp.]